MTVDHTVTTPEAPPRPTRVPGWRFWLPLGLQLLIVAAVPAPQIWAHATGTTVLLRTAPVDPYDVLRGRFMRLGYADQTVEALKKLPGWRDDLTSPPRELWVEFRPGPAGQPWAPVAVHEARPRDLAAGHVVIRGKTDGGGVDWGLSEYFVPEEAGDGIEAAMAKARREGILVEVRVDAGGTAVIEGLWITGRRY